MITTVGGLVKTLLNLDQQKYILIGDEDKYGRNDISINSILRKQHGFDESNDYYYVITGNEHKDGCIRY